MNKSERERKENLLSERVPAIEQAAMHHQQLLSRYSAGELVRRELADNIVAEFRHVLRAHEHGPNYDGPLYARIIEALIAAEEHGCVVAERGEKQERATEELNQLFNERSSESIQPE